MRNSKLIDSIVERCGLQRLAPNRNSIGDKTFDEGIVLQGWRQGAGVIFYHAAVTAVRRWCNLEAADGLNGDD
ncbi:MAG: hypothetical protein P8L31_09060 [Pseudomonadales bacterium]|nr:hypothetical protein [Pseudomonadales bacterium]